MIHHRASAIRLPPITMRSKAAVEAPEFLKEHIDKVWGAGGLQSLCRRLGALYGHAVSVDQTGGVALGRNAERSDCPIRSQFHHVIDIAPTILEVARLPEPLSVHGVLQRPMEGVSMAYSFDDAKAGERNETQYFGMFGNRGIYHKGWTAVTKHRVPWEANPKLPAFNNDIWKLYDTNTDCSPSKNLAKEQRNQR